MTEWRTLDWLPGYEISEAGEVRTTDGIICNQSNHTMGYRWVRAAKKLHLVHRLVCEAFHGPPFEGAEAAHYDGQRAHNHFTNLRWATRSENQNDRRRHGTLNAGERSPQAKTDWATVRTLRAEFTGARGEVAMLARKYGLRPNNALAILSERSWKPRNDPSIIGSGDVG